MSLVSRMVRDRGTVFAQPDAGRVFDTTQTSTASQAAAYGLVTVTAHASAHTKGSWATLIPALAGETSSLCVGVQSGGSSGADRASLLDLAIGPSSSPVMLAENIQIPAVFSQLLRPTTIPLRVPKGAEIIARIQNGTGGVALSFVPHAVGDPTGIAPCFTECVTYGAVTATSRGTVLTAPGANNAFGAWTEISASTPNPIHGLGVGVEAGYLPGYNNTLARIEIGYGPLGSEVSIFDSVVYAPANNETIAAIWPADLLLPAAFDVPKGARLVARLMTNNISQPHTVILYGFS